MEQILTGQSHMFVLAELNIAQASANLALIVEALKCNERIVLDLSACDEVDTAGLQLLAAIRLDPMFQNRVHWTGCTQVFLHKAECLGLGDLLTMEVRGIQ